ISPNSRLPTPDSRLPHLPQLSTINNQLPMSILQSWAILRPQRLVGVVLGVSVFLGGCEPPPDITETSTEDSADTVIEDQQLTLQNATLENSTEDGQPLWKINAKKTVYSENQQNADLEKVTGNLFSEGELAVQFQADRGKIIQDGEKLLLRDNIIATDPRNGVSLRCEELDWFPDEGRLVVRQNVQGSHEQVELSAQQGQYWSQEQRLEVTGEIIATARQSPLQLKTEKLIWYVPEQKLESPEPLQADRYEEISVAGQTETEKKISDRILADQGEMNLETQVLILTDNVKSTSQDPPLQIASNSIIWTLIERTVSSNEPVQLYHLEENVLVSGNRGFVNLDQKIARLQDGVRGLSQNEEADLYAQKILWNIDAQRLEAEGNVIYQQVDPPMNVTGARAVGQLNKKTITVTRTGQNRRVMTRVIPQD
ncbi:LPS export ABC transporter periplasmic protein LptC, partial [Spirulina sp. CS-785/01]|uniref:LPS export ABC transporter periplasmic protein LptC n=1 Tax=Spirulina sp. CS-785/01 TaxID=3021716 RepID=UPI00232AD6AF